MVGEYGLSISGVPRSKEELMRTREDFERIQISDALYMMKSAETEEEREYWREVLNFYKTKMLLEKSILE